MELFWEMLSLQGTLFLLILAGVLAKKTGIVSETGRKTLSDLLIYIVLPCNILESFLSGGQMPEGFVRNCLLAVGISAGIQLLAVYGSKLLFRKYPRGEKSVLSYGMICSNSGFIGLPIARLMFGDLGVIYTSVFQIPLRFTMWTAGLSLFTSVSRKDAFRKLARHPCIIAVFVGLALMAVPIQLPGVLSDALDSLSGLHGAPVHAGDRHHPGGRAHPLHVLPAGAVVLLPAAGAVPPADLGAAAAPWAGPDAGERVRADDGDARRQHRLHPGGQVRRRGPVRLRAGLRVHAVLHRDHPAADTAAEHGLSGRERQTRRHPRLPFRCLRRAGVDRTGAARA